MIKATRIFAWMVICGMLVGACTPQATPAPAQTTAAAPAATSVSQATPTEVPTPVAAEKWWNDAVFYEVFVRSFKDSDGDGVGDLNGLIENLDYLNDGDPATTTDLGVTGIWLMPITQSPSYHGYDVVDYYTVDNEYGTPDDFRRLMEEAHKRGIRVIVDMVLNHTGKDHPWFVESRNKNPEYRDWYIWSEKNPGFKGPWDQTVWYSAGGAYYYAIFWDGMPDLNLANPEVTAEVYDILRFWIEEMQVDGFRLDAVRHYVERGSIQENTEETHAWLRDFFTYYKSLNPNAFTIGEAWTETSQVLDYIGDEVDTAFEFDLAESILTSAAGPIATAVTKQMQVVLDSYPEGQYGVFITNHDQDRVMSVLKDEAGAKLAATMLLTAPGVPFIYYGEEIGMTGVKPDEDIRRPLQWSGESPKVGFTTGSPWRMPSSDFPEVNIAAQADDPGSLLSHYRNLIILRNSHAALRTGKALVVDTGSPRLYALLRYDGDEAFLVLVNVHPKSLTGSQYALALESGPFSGAVLAEVVLGAGDPALPQINAAGGFDDYIPLVEIPARSSVIIRLAP